MKQMTVLEGNSSTQVCCMNAHTVLFFSCLSFFLRLKNIIGYPSGRMSQPLPRRYSKEDKDFLRSLTFPQKDWHLLTSAPWAGRPQLEHRAESEMASTRSRPALFDHLAGAQPLYRTVLLYQHRGIWNRYTNHPTGPYAEQL